MVGVCCSTMELSIKVLGSLDNPEGEMTPISDVFSCHFTGQNLQGLRMFWVLGLFAEIVSHWRNSSSRGRTEDGLCATRLRSCQGTLRLATTTLPVHCFTRKGAVRITGWSHFRSGCLLRGISVSLACHRFLRGQCWGHLRATYEKGKLPVDLQFFVVDGFLMIFTQSSSCRSSTARCLPMNSISPSCLGQILSGIGSSVGNRWTRNRWPQYHEQVSWVTESEAAHRSFL